MNQAETGVFVIWLMLIVVVAVLGGGLIAGVIMALVGVLMAFVGVRRRRARSPS
jgi:threonine dehydratase